MYSFTTHLKMISQMSNSTWNLQIFNCEQLFTYKTGDWASKANGILK